MLIDDNRKKNTKGRNVTDGYKVHKNETEDKTVSPYNKKVLRNLSGEQIKVIKSWKQSSCLDIWKSSTFVLIKHKQIHLKYCYWN